VLQLLGPTREPGWYLFQFSRTRRPDGFETPQTSSAVMIVRVAAVSILSQSVIFSQEACKGSRFFPDTVLVVILCAATVLSDHRLSFAIDFALRGRRFRRSKRLAHSPAQIRYNGSIAAIPVRAQKAFCHGHSITEAAWPSAETLDHPTRLF
jgi:hypothetical protein